MTQDIDIRMLLFRARLLLEEGQDDKALPILEAIQTDNKKEQEEIAYLLGWCYVSNRRWDDATRVLSPVPNFEEDDESEENRVDRVRLVQSLLRLGQAAVNLHQFEDASRHYSRCLKVLQSKKIHLPVAKLKARYSLAMTYLMRGQYPASIQHYELALGLCLYIDDDEEIGHIYYGLCEAYRRSGKLIEAQLACVKALELYERCKNRHLEGIAHNMLGLIYLNLGDYRASSDHYTEALSLAASHNEPKMVMVNCTALAGVRLAEGRLEEAKRYNQRALENIDRIQFKDRYLESLTYLVCGKVTQAEAQQVEGEQRQRLLEEAISWFQQAQGGFSPSQAYSEVTDLYGRWAEVLEQLGRYEEAISCWKTGYEAISAANGPAWY
jgi:tetratricopeptide (TPR) repeat protein